MILVTGAFGFIGSHLVEKLLELGEKVIALSKPNPPENNYHYLVGHPKSSNLRVALIDVTDYDSLVKLIREEDVRLVYHLAAIASHRLSIDEPYKYLRVNYLSVLNMLEAARTCDPSPKIVFASSSSVYGDAPPPLREDMDPRPKGPYALSKFFGERLCKLYNESYGVECPIIRYFNVVGERCRRNIVFRIFAEQIINGQPVEVYGKWVDGVFKPAERDFTYIADAVEGTILVGEKARRSEIFNLGFGRPVSVLKVAELLMEALGRRVEVIEKELKPHEALISYSSNEKARKLLGWSPRVNIEEMVKRYAEWFLKQYGSSERVRD